MMISNVLVIKYLFMNINISYFFNVIFPVLNTVLNTVLNIY